MPGTQGEGCARDGASQSEAQKAKTRRNLKNMSTGDYQRTKHRGSHCRPIGVRGKPRGWTGVGSSTDTQGKGEELKGPLNKLR